MNNLEKKILELLFDGKVDLYIILDDNSPFFLCLNEEELKNRFEVINSLIEKRMLKICDVSCRSFFFKVDRKIKIYRGEYWLCITRKGGFYIQKINKIKDDIIFNVNKVINNDIVVYDIIAPKNRINCLIEKLNNFNIKYEISNLEYWYPFYWKRKKGGKKITIKVKEIFFNNNILPLITK